MLIVLFVLFTKIINKVKNTLIGIIKMSFKGFIIKNIFKICFIKKKYYF